MIVDPSELNGVFELNADLCILGAGPSGLTLARELEDGAIGGTAHFPHMFYRKLVVKRPFPDTSIVRGDDFDQRPIIGFMSALQQLFR